jgi:hypothetical protein
MLRARVPPKAGVRAGMARAPSDGPRPAPDAPGPRDQRDEHPRPPRADRHARRARRAGAGERRCAPSAARGGPTHARRPELPPPPGAAWRRVAADAPLASRASERPAHEPACRHEHRDRSWSASAADRRRPCPRLPGRAQPPPGSARSRAPRAPRAPRQPSTPPARSAPQAWRQPARRPEPGRPGPRQVAWRARSCASAGRRAGPGSPAPRRRRGCRGGGRGRRPRRLRSARRPRPPDPRPRSLRCRSRSSRDG